MQRFYRLIAAVLFLALMLIACDNNQLATLPESATSNQPIESATSGSTESPAATKPLDRGKLKIKEVTFTHALNEDMTPADVAETFTPDQDIFISVKLNGTPKEGVVSATFYYGNQLIADARVDLAKTRDEQGVIFVLGGDTFVGFTLSHNTPFPPSNNYRAEIALNGAPAEKYNFQVVPPTDAIPSKLLSATLSEDVQADTYEPYHPTSTFPADKAVFLAGRVDLGRGSTLAAEWYINGELDEAATRVLSSSEDAPDVPFYFTYLPKGNWPIGTHKIILLINDEPAGEYKFTIIANES
jgi:hypothetical protein